MYLWNVKALAEDLKADKVSQKDKLKYYFLVILGFQILLIAAENTPTRTSYINSIIRLIECAITFIGIWLCYEANRFGDNKNFIERIICLAVPLGIRFRLISMVIYLILVFIYPTQKDELLFTFIDVPVFCLLDIFYYAVLRSYILDISGANRENNATAPPTA